MAATSPVDSVCTRKTTRLCHLSSRRPRVVLSRQLVVALPLAVLSLHLPLVVLSRQLVVTSPFDEPTSRHLIVSLCHLSLSRRASWLSHHHLLSSSCCTALSSSHRAGWLLCCLSLRRPLVVASPLVILSFRRSLVVLSCQLVVALPLLALSRPSRQVITPDCCPIASPCPLVAPRTALSSSRRAGWLLRRLSTRCPLVILSSCCAASCCLVVSAGCRTIISRRPLVAPPSLPLIVPSPPSNSDARRRHPPLLMSISIVVSSLPILSPHRCRCRTLPPPPLNAIFIVHHH